MKPRTLAHTMSDQNEERENGSESSNGHGAKQRCEACRRELEMGQDAILVQEGVVGPRGFVPLEDPECFCSTKCVGDHYGDRDMDKLPRRVP